MLFICGGVSFEVLDLILAAGIAPLISGLLEIHTLAIAHAAN